MEHKTLTEGDGNDLLRWVCACSDRGPWTFSMRAVRRGAVDHRDPEPQQSED